MFRVHGINIWKSDGLDFVGDAILLEHEDSAGNKIYGMIDAGGPMKSVSGATTGAQVDDSGNVCAFLANQGVTQLEFIIQTHFHSDHSMEMPEVIKNYKPKVYYAIFPDFSKLSDIESNDTSNFFTDDYTAYVQNQLAASGMTATVPTEGQSIAFGDATITIWNTNGINSPNIAQDYNKASLITHVRYINRDWLFMGDSTPDYSEAIVRNLFPNGGLDVLWCPHHGNGGNTNASEILFMTPEVFAMCSARNTGWAEKQKTVARLRYRGAVTYMFNWTGDVLVESDGYGVSLTGALDFHPTGIAFDDADGFIRVYDDNANLVTTVGLVTVGKLNGGTMSYFMIQNPNNASDTIKVASTEGWHWTGASWYYLCPQGMYSSESSNPKYFEKSQAMQSCWYLENGNWYYFKDDCLAARNETVTYGGVNYNFDTNGVCLNP